MPYESAYELYLKDLAWVPGRLTEEEEQDLFARVAQGDREARDRIISSLLAYVIFVAVRYRRHDVELADLVQCGNIGLIRAVSKFHPEARIRFITYAHYHIRASILQCIEESRMITLPGKFQTRLKRLRSAYEALWRREGREPTIEELAKEAKVTPIYARDFLTMSNTEPLSLEIVIRTGPDGDQRTLGNLLQAPPLVVPERDLTGKARELLDQLPADERQVLGLFFGLEPGQAPMSDAAIARALNLDAKKIYRIRHRALQRLSLSSTAWGIISELR